MSNDEIDEQLKYYKSQDISWRDLGYDPYLTKRQQLIQGGFLSPYELSAVMEPGAIMGDQLREISGDKIVTDTLDDRSIKTSILEAAVDIGNPTAGFIRIDGPNKRIIGNDGTTNTLVIQV